MNKTRRRKQRARQSEATFDGPYPFVPSGNGRTVVATFPVAAGRLWNEPIKYRVRLNARTREMTAFVEKR